MSITPETIINHNLPQSLITATPAQQLDALFALREVTIHGISLETTAGIELCGAAVSVDLSDNDISTVDSLDLLPDLARLNLSNNALSSVPDLRLCGSLKHLELQNNCISRVDAHYLPRNLDYLDIRHNGLAPSAQNELKNRLPATQILFEPQQRLSNPATRSFSVTNNLATTAAAGAVAGAAGAVDAVLLRAVESFEREVAQLGTSAGQDALERARARRRERENERVELRKAARPH